jgi:O-antigen/teichoic acid export membrane protein
MKDFFRKIMDIGIKFKDLSAIAIATLIGNAISAVFWLVLASMMGAEQYGEINYFIAIASVASAISFLGAGNALTVFSAKEKRIESPILIVTTITSIITSLVILTLFSNIAISLYIIGYVIFNHLLYETLGKKLYPSFAKYYIIQRVLLVVFAFGFYFLLGPIGIVLGYAFSFMPFVIKRYKSYRISKKEFSLLKEKIPFMRDSYGHSMVTVLGTYADKLIVAPLFGYSFLGNYQLSFQILMILTMISSMVFTYLLPQEASGKPHRKLWLITILFVLVSSILTIVLAPSVLPILMPKYVPAINLIQIMSIAAVPMTITLRYTSKFLGNEKSKIVIIGSIIYLVSHIIGIFSIGKIMGIQGVAISFVIASSIEAIFFVTINRILDKKVIN